MLLPHHDLRQALLRDELRLVAQARPPALPEPRRARIWRLRLPAAGRRPVVPREAFEG
jgi:hypothetical protein